jgi:iron-sulfur cluster repair protein YtfE (RIC family)
MTTTYQKSAASAIAPDDALLALTVNQALAQWPEAVRALNDFGVDTCCGGSATLAEAAIEAGIPASALLDAIVPGRVSPNAVPQP